MDDATADIIRRTALQNALEHDGKTRDSIVMAKVLGARPDLRGSAKDLMRDISSIVAEINSMDADTQKREAESRYPDMLAPKDRPQKTEQTLPPLDDATEGQVITRFPPEPNGYPHIGHGKAAIINDEYVRMYGGKRILRLDDTNPESERLEYYAAIKVGLEWLGIKYDIVKNTSDDIELIYEKGIELIDNGSAYVCTCKRDEISANRREMVSCRCSDNDIGENQKRWEKMSKKYKPGDAIVRFRGDMGSDNTVMRDPVLFRIIDAKHPLLGKKYRIWPSYDLAVAIEDSIDGVTHAFRSKEYELRNELYYSILDALSMRKPRVIEFSRLEFKGMPVSKRVLRPLIEEGKVGWYDDPRLPTLEALKRRGIQPEAVRRFIMSLGFTKSDTLAPFESLVAYNRKLIDARCTRLHMVAGPQKVEVSGLPRSVSLTNHPSGQMGSRDIAPGGAVLVQGSDLEGVEQGAIIRLMGLGNIRMTSVSPAKAEYAGDDQGLDCPKMQWVPEDGSYEIKILVPHELFVDDAYNESSLEKVMAMVEPHYADLPDGQLVQFVRFGYCRKDSRNVAIFAHR